MRSDILLESSLGRETNSSLPGAGFKMEAWNCLVVWATTGLQRNALDGRHGCVLQNCMGTGVGHQADTHLPSPLSSRKICQRCAVSTTGGGTPRWGSSQLLQSMTPQGRFPLQQPKTNAHLPPTACLFVPAFGFDKLPPQIIFFS
eukprot:EG_transcript_13880